LWYYPSGKLYSLQRYKEGLWHGPQEFYYEDGKVKTLMYYDAGKLVGKAFVNRSI
jgi:antitoxin component YwqK of YwqJK toxin-antitoxin module